MKNKKKMNNKGFSLVELIIVIAIMAVLVGVLAPQYMKYVEKGRVSADRDSVEAIINALQTYAVDPDVAAADKIATGSAITITNAADVTVSTGNLDKALENAGIPTTIPALTSRSTIDKVVITYTESGTTFTVTAAYSKGGTAVTF